METEACWDAAPSGELPLTAVEQRGHSGHIGHQEMMWHSECTSSSLKKPGKPLVSQDSPRRTINLATIMGTLSTSSWAELTST